MTGAVAAPDLRPWPVGPQRQRGDAVELRPPVIELLLGGRRPGPAPLPERNRGTGRRARAVPPRRFARCRIMRGELLPEQPLRPAVGDEVMDVDHQRMAGLVERQQRDLQRRLVREVERMLREPSASRLMIAPCLSAAQGLSLIRSNRGGDCSTAAPARPRVR